MKPVTLSWVPAVVPVTVTVNVQVPPAAMIPPVRVIARVAALVVSVPAVHCEDVESRIDRPAGRTSENVTPVSAWLPGEVLGMLKVSADVAPCAIDVGENDLVIVGAGAGT